MCTNQRGEAVAVFLDISLWSNPSIIDSRHSVEWFTANHIVNATDIEAL